VDEQDSRFVEWTTRRVRDDYDLWRQVNDAPYISIALKTSIVES
jgi:hypothetical protein